MCVCGGVRVVSGGVMVTPRSFIFFLHRSHLAAISCIWKWALALPSLWLGDNDRNVN